MPARERILIIRTSAMGDIVHALPVLSQLRAERPEARIGWLVERVFAPLLAGHPDLDELIPVGLRTWRHRPFSASTWREIGELRAAVEAFAPDVALDLMGTHKSGVLAAFTLADRRLGLAKRDRREPSSSIWLSDTVPAVGAHAVDRALSVLEALDIDPKAGEADFGGPRLPETPGAGGPSPGESFALLHPRTGWANKNYPERSWARVVRKLGERTGIGTWIAWGPGEESTAREIAEASGARVLSELVSLPQLTGLSRRARLVLGGDTGPVHLAHALGTPVVCVMGPTDPERNGPYGSPERTVVHRLPCSFCHKRLDSPRACLLDISPELVAERALALLR